LEPSVISLPRFGVFWQERMTAMTTGIDPVAPPARIKKKLMAPGLSPKQRG